jgi:hypothetical protein
MVRAVGEGKLLVLALVCGSLGCGGAGGLKGGTGGTGAAAGVATGGVGTGGGATGGVGAGGNAAGGTVGTGGIGSGGIGAGGIAAGGTTGTVASGGAGARDAAMTGGGGGAADAAVTGGAGGTVDAAMTGGAGGTVDAAPRPDVPSSNCVSESDCTGVGLHCDRNTRLCVECRNRDDCAATEQCTAGSCVSCTTGVRVCSAGGRDILVCSPEEGKWTLVETCSNGVECNEYTKTCTAPVVCTPNQPACNGEIATTCNADGTGYVSGGISCAGTGQLCYQGVCAGCWPTTYSCSGSTVRHCAADGLSSTASATCTSSQYCDPVTGMCKTRVCTPGQPACNGETVTTCNVDGSGYTAGGTSCTDTGGFCHQGACASLACSPGRDFCSGPTVRHCADDGTSSTLSATCTDLQYCDSATAKCRQRVCPPGEPVCVGEWATTCNADGSGHAGGGHLCNSGSEEICTDGLCLSIAGCTPSGKTLCLGSKVVQCYSNGYAHPRESCTSSEYCDTATARCMPLLCTPEQPACNGNHATVCSADGKSYAGEGTSCGTRHCVNGTCKDALFAEDFEDGDLVGWGGDLDGWQISADGHPYATRTMAPAYAAAGSRYGLLMESGASLSGSLDGISQSFAGLKPSRMSWWMMAPSSTAAGGYFAVSAPGGYYFAVSYFAENGELVLGYSTAGVGKVFVTIPYMAQTWYHVELRNIDWTDKSFDYYVNDTLVRAAAPLGAESPDGIVGLSLLHPVGATTYWDEIEFE